MRVIHLCIYCLVSGTFLSCVNNESIEDVSEAYCKCIQLKDKQKDACVLQWSNKNKGIIKDKENHKKLMYSMIECNGFEGETHFNQILKE